MGGEFVAEGSGTDLGVLVIDDRPDVADTIAAMCRALGFRATVASAGVGVRALLVRNAPHCVIVDIMMPDEDGYEALKEIAAFDSRLPVLLISGYGQSWLDMGLTLGRAHGLALLEAASKPLRMETLKDFLSRV